MSDKKTEKLFTKALTASRTGKERGSLGYTVRKGMMCPSASALVAEFRDLDAKGANAIRKLCKTVDEPYALEALIEKHHPKTNAYVRSLHNNPYISRIWRRTVVLHAVNQLVDGHGVEAIGSSYEYINMGDPYTGTLIYKTASNRLFIGSWGDVVEKDRSLQNKSGY